MSESLLHFLLNEIKQFVQSASQLDGVTRIALVGSLVTEKVSPKDADLLITISETTDIDSLAALDRKLKGHAQSRNSGADIILCDSKGEYLDSSCSYKDCHPRSACLGYQCILGTRICNDLDNLHLDSKLIQEPPLELWPVIVRRKQIPQDVENILLN